MDPGKLATRAAVRRAFGLSLSLAHSTLSLLECAISFVVQSRSHWEKASPPQTRRSTGRVDPPTRVQFPNFRLQLPCACTRELNQTEKVALRDGKRHSVTSSVAYCTVDFSAHYAFRPIESAQRITSHECFHGSMTLLLFPWHLIPKRGCPCSTLT